MTLFVVDDGSSAIKAKAEVNGTLETVSFNSLVVKGAKLNTSLKYDKAAYITDDAPYSVVESSRPGQDLKTNDLDYHTSSHNRVLVRHAIKKLGLFGHKLNVVATIPVGSFFKMQNGLHVKNEELIEGKRASLLKDVQSLDGLESPIIESVRILPEGVPAFAAAKHELGLVGNRFLVVDIGGTTTDIVLIVGEAGQIDHFASLDIGAIDITTKFARAVEDRFAISSVSRSEAYEGFLKGTIRGRDVSDLATRYQNELKTLVSNAISDVDALDSFDYVIYSGGGAHLMDVSRPNETKTKQPELDNAQGAYMIMKAVELQNSL